MKSVKLSILFFVVCFTSAYARFAGGNGTETDPYQIETAEQLGYLKEFLADKSAKGEYFILTQDIDLSTYLSPGNPGYNNGAGWEPISSLIPFEGTINGNGKVIKNLWCNRPGESYVGFMSQLGRYGKIDRLGVEIDENKAIKGESVGALVGYSSGFINECYTKGSITSAETSDMNCYVGGIAGIGNGSILNSYSVCDISIPIPGYPRVGGLVGIGAYIYKCYFGGKINAPRGDVGGLVGCIVSCDIIECASSGEWIRSDIHPIYGINMARGNSKQEIRDNYLGVSYIQSTYESLNWDFQKVWTMPSAEGLPILAWQVKTTPQPVKFAGGTGMETDPYLIANAGELTLLNNYLGNKGLGKYFRLTQDIDLTAYLTGKADGWLPVGNDVNKFNGKFDGNQKNITGLYINRKDHEKYEEDDCIGLFGALGAVVEVKNVCFNFDIH